MNIQDEIKKQVEGHPVVLYMKGTPDFPQCGFSGKVIQILRQCDADFVSFNVLENADLRQAIKTYSNWPTIPQLYVNGEFVGGSDILGELFENGELKKMIDKVKAK